MFQECTQRFCNIYIKTLLYISTSVLKLMFGAQDSENTVNPTLVDGNEQAIISKASGWLFEAWNPTVWHGNITCLPSPQRKVIFKDHFCRNGYTFSHFEIFFIKCFFIKCIPIFDFCQKNRPKCRDLLLHHFWVIFVWWWW